MYELIPVYFLKSFRILAPMETGTYIFAGVGVAVSLIAFLLKRFKVELDQVKSAQREVEIDLTKQTERTKTCLKLLEDRRRDVQNIYDKISK